MSDAFPITIYHNPYYGTSRTALVMIEAAGYRPTVVDYRIAGWSGAQIEQLFAAVGASSPTAMRETGAPAWQRGLLKNGATDAKIIEAMVEHPIPVNRADRRDAEGRPIMLPVRTAAGVAR